MKKAYTTLFFFALLLSLLVTDALAAESAAKIIQKTKAKYESIKYLSLRFQQRFEWALTGEVQELSGLVLVAPGDRYRVETNTQIIVSDGKTLWTYNKPTRQVIVDNLGTEKTPLLRDLVLRYTQDYKATLAGEDTVAGRKCWVLDLVASGEGEFVPHIKVWVDKREYIIWQVEEKDANGNVNRYRITVFEEPSSLPDRLFHFKIPEGVEVVDLRSE
ncbi:MAG: outer membrane lipoprotein carrier protein LolA [Calditrichaeota bacterium]|nr:outer membrane lipoprotein carrier protein LolA [Calditrichota bacterium]